jgi:hypothetical protein
MLPEATRRCSALCGPEDIDAHTCAKAAGSDKVCTEDFNRFDNKILALNGG